MVAKWPKWKRNALGPVPAAPKFPSVRPPDAEQEVDRVTRDKGGSGMKTIWKYRLSDDGELTELSVPQGAEFLTAQIQQDWICVWALVDPAAPEVTRRILLVGTGITVRYSPVKYIGTVANNGFVFHVFEVPKDAVKEQ